MADLCAGDPGLIMSQLAVVSSLDISININCGVLLFIAQSTTCLT